MPELSRTHIILFFVHCHYKAVFRYYSQLYSPLSFHNKICWVNQHIYVVIMQIRDVARTLLQVERLILKRKDKGKAFCKIKKGNYRQKVISLLKLKVTVTARRVYRKTYFLSTIFTFLEGFSHFRRVFTSFLVLRAPSFDLASKAPLFRKVYEGNGRI